VLEQHEGEQPHDLGLRGKEPQEEPAEADRLGAERRAGAVGCDVGRVPLVEEEVDHGSDRGETLAALDGARCLEGHVGRRYCALGPGDPLLHRRLGDEEGAGDAGDGHAGDDPERQRDLPGGAEAGMAADEEEPQDVVAVICRIDPVDEGLLGIGKVAERLLRRQRPLARLAAGAVDASVAPYHDEPGRGVARRAIARPGLQSAQAGLLERLLRPVEVAEPAQQGRDRLGPRAGEDRADPALVCHPGGVPGL
jgi:hypothetical protein